MKYLSVCSGIEAASVAWHPLGWEPVGFAEIEKFPSQVLAHRFPGVPNYGDMTKYKEWDIDPGTIDILVGGTPCQAFSVAGLRKGLQDPRGNLALTFVAMVDHYRPEWVVWENVPGVLSSNGGRDFGSFLGALGQLGYGWCYRVLDAQYFGVAQRRRRVFVVAHSSGDPRRCAEVLFEPESLRGDPPPSREAGQGIASGAGKGSVGGGCWWDGGQVSQTLDAVLTQYQTMPEKNRFPAVLQPSLYESHPQDCRVTGPVEQCPTVSAKWGTGGNNTPLVTDGSIGFAENFTAIELTQTTPAMTTSGYSPTQNAGGLGVLQCDAATHFRKSKRAQSVNDDETWVESEVTNTMNVFDQGDVRATDVVVHPNEASAFSWQCRGDMRGMVPRPTAQLQRCQIEAVMVPEQDAVHVQWDASSVVAPNLTASNDPSRSPQSSEITQQVSAVVQATYPTMHVRRLTPVECERLQGFPDGWTDIRPNGKDTPDSPRYKALGNSMAVPVMRWIGMRIAEASRG